MARRVYLLPQIVTATDPTYRCPKYVPHRLNAPPLPGLAGMSWSWEFASLGDWGLLRAEGTPAQLALLAAQPDVLALPDDLDAPLTAPQVSAGAAWLEAQTFPADWLTIGMTTRQALRRIVRHLMVHNRIVGALQRRLFDGTLDLTRTVGSLPATVRQRLADAADSLGLDRSGVTASTTLRQLLRGLADQLPDVSAGRVES